MKTRMQPIGNAWQKLPRIVRDLSAELGKQIELEMHGADTELDRQVLDLIKDPLTHMVRNSADHGIEMPAERVAAGKPEQRHDPALAPITKAATSSSTSPTTAAASTPSAIKAKALANGHRYRSRTREDDGSADPQLHLRAGLLDRGEGHQRLRPRRRHGCGAHQHRPDRRHHRAEVGAGRGHELHHQDPADAGHRLGADRRGGGRALRHSAALGRRTRARARELGASHRADQGHAGAAAAQQAAAADPSAEAAQDR